MNVNSENGTNGDHPKLVNTQTIDLSEIGNITINYGNDNALFYKGDTNELIIKEYINIDDKKYYAYIKNQDNEIIVTSGERPKKCKSYIEIYLPLTYNKGVSVNLGNGGLKIDDPFAFDHVNFKTDNGSINISNLVTNMFNLKSDNGIINIDNITADKLNIKTDNGGIGTKNITADTLNIKSNNGSIITKNITADKLNIKTYNGGVNIENVTDDTLNIKTDNGNIDINNVTGKYVINTRNGGINIDNAKGYGVFKSDNGVMNIIFVEVSDNINAESYKGKINLTIPQALAFNYKAATFNGVITTNFNGVQTKSEKSQSGLIGEKPEVKIEVNTSVGDIDINN